MAGGKEKETLLKVWEIMLITNQFRNDNAFLNLKCELIGIFYLNHPDFILWFCERHHCNLRFFVTHADRVFYLSMQYIFIECLMCSRHCVDQWWAKPNTVSNIIEYSLSCSSVLFWSFMGLEDVKWWWRISSPFKVILKHLLVKPSYTFFAFYSVIFLYIFWNILLW